MLRFSSLKVLVLLLALALCTGNVFASAPVLSATGGGTGVNLTWVQGGPNLTTQTWGTNSTVTLSAASGSDANLYVVSISTSQTGAIQQNWLTATVTAPAHVQGTLTTTAALTVAVNPGAGLNALTPGSYPFSFKLATHVGAGAVSDDIAISGKLTVINSPLAAAPVVIQGIKNAVVPASQAGGVTGLAAVVFTVDAATLPFWLTSTCMTVADACTSTVGGNGGAITFTVAAPILSSFAPGNYPVSVGIKAVGYTNEMSMSVTLQLTNTNPGSFHVTDGNGNLLAASGTTSSYFASSPTNLAPTTITSVVANSDPVTFGVTCVATTANGVTPSSPVPCVMKDANGKTVSTNIVAYTWGTPLVAVPDPTWFNQEVGAVVNVMVEVTVGASSPQDFNYSYTFVGNPVTLTAPAFPTSAQAFTSSGSLMVMLTGTGFVGASNVVNASGFSATQVWYADTAAHLTTSTAGSVNVSNIIVDASGTHMYVTIPGSAWTNKAGNVLYIGVANQVTTTALTHLPTGGVSTSLKITANPVISSMANAATYAMPNIGTASVAPYELISLFGNFVTAADIPSANNGIVSGSLDAFGKFPTVLKVNSTGNTVSVGFYTDASHSQATLAFLAPILFATPTQINAIVPSGLTPGTPYYVSVNYHTVVGSVKTDNYSDSFAVQIVAADPGVFTLGSDGHGQGAIIVSHTNAGVTTTFLNSSTAQAGVNDTLAIYMTGLGLPDSSDPDDASTPTGQGCMQDQAYAAAVNGLTPAPTSPWTNIDGAVLQTANFQGGHIQPCLGLATLPVTVTIYDPAGLVAPITATASYAGFVANSVAGLYQVNVQLPALTGFTNLTTPAPLMVSLSSVPPTGGAVPLGASPQWATVFLH